jgi:histidinol-phosphate aminotransferase
MSAQFNRRSWIKTSAMLSAGVAMATSNWAGLQAKPLVKGQNLSRKILAQMAADLPPIKARLFANENQFGPSENAKKAIIEALPTSNLYPFMEMKKFTELLAREEGVTPDHILLGAGSSELLMASSIYYGLLQKGKRILSADPSYTYLMEVAETYGAGWDKVPLTKDYAHDLDAMEKKVTDKTSLVYICNPNNPTGTILQPEKLKSFCEVVSKRRPVFVDEAYIDYVDDPKKQSMIDCVRKGQNVIVARTFSKVHGFAGLRMGYIVALPETIKQIEPYCTGGMNIGGPPVMGAMSSLMDTEFINYSVKKNAESRNFLYALLKEEGYEYIPSHTNFVMFPLKMEAKKFRDEMMKRGVGVRNWEFSNKQWCRVSMGTMDQMQIFAEAFKQLS